MIHPTIAARLLKLVASASGANIASFGMAAVFGLGANMAVLVFWGEAGMGVFAQAFAIYIFSSQLSVGGVQNATLAYIARRPAPARIRSILYSALLLTVAGSLIVVLVLNLAASSLGDVMGSQSVALTIQAFTLSIFAGSANKVLLSALNGASRFYAFALLQGARAFLILICVLVAGYTKVPIERMPLYFGLGEAITTLIGLVLVRNWLTLPNRRIMRAAFPRLLRFGFHSMPSGAFAELNSRIDVLILGLFASDAVVGLYAFAALLAEGYYNLIVVARVILTPRITALLARRNNDELRRLFTQTAWPLLGAAWLALILICGLVIYGLPLVGNGLDPVETVTLFVIIGFGIGSTAFVLPYNTLLMLGGRPALHSLYLLAVLAINLGGSLMLAPTFGATGAAIATSASYIGAALLLIVSARYTFGLRLP